MIEGWPSFAGRVNVRPRWVEPPEGGGRPRRTLTVCAEFWSQYRGGGETMRSNNVIMIIVAIAMGGGAAYLARSWLQDQLDASAVHPPATHVVIAAEPLAYGAALTSENVTEIPWFTKLLPEGAFASKDDLLNGGRRTVLYPLKQGEPVLRSKVTGPGQRASLAAVLEDGKRAVTVRVDDVRGVAGFVLPGDFVDIVMIAEEPSSKR